MSNSKRGRRKNERNKPTSRLLVSVHVAKRFVLPFPPTAPVSDAIIVGTHVPGMYSTGSYRAYSTVPRQKHDSFATSHMTCLHLTKRSNDFPEPLLALKVSSLLSPYALRPAAFNSIRT